MMTKFDTRNEALSALNRQKEFIANIQDTTCEWGTKSQGILNRMRARDFNYSAKEEDGIYVIKYSYSDNFNNLLEGSIIVENN